jgi:hypothetical protein
MYRDRVKDTTTSTGTTAITLAGVAPTGYQTFATAFGASSQTVAYCIADQTGANWEVGTGVFNGTTGITRTAGNVLGGSAGAGVLVNFLAGTKDVFCTAPATYLLPFTSTTQGVVSASGGGTTNYLRADGTFAVPPGTVTTPAGSTTQVQYNNAGAFAGNANFTYTSATNTLTVGNILGSGAAVGGVAPTLLIQPRAPLVTETAGALRLSSQVAQKANTNGGGVQIVAERGNGTGVGGRIIIESKITGASLSGSYIQIDPTFISIQDASGSTLQFGQGSLTFTGGNATSDVTGYCQFSASIRFDGAGYGPISFNGDAINGTFIIEEAVFGVPKISFFGAPVVERAAAYNQTYVTASRTVANPTFTNLVTTAATNVVPYGFTTQAQADAIATKVNQLAADVVILRQLINSLIDDSQAYGLVAP